MDWMRRNWPDLLIGLALVAVIAGIVTTLLTGGSLFPLGGGSQEPDTPPAVAAPPDPAAGGPVDPPQEGGLGDPLAVPPGAPDPTVDGDAGLAAPPGAPDPDADADPGPGGAAQDAPAAPGAAVAPLAPGDPPTDPPTVDVPATPAAEEPEPQAVAPEPEPAPEPAPEPVVAPEPAAQPDPAPTSADAPSDPYRISVGAFGDQANAERQADRFRADGYPVFLGTQGNLTLVLVGPYVQEAQARSVAAEIRAGDYGIEPVLYVFDPGGPGAAAAPAPEAASPAPAAPEPVAAAEEDPDPDPVPDAPAATADGALLQVGAFADRASAEPLIERLQGLGFSARPLDEDGLVKLVVGPFSGEALSDARTLLNGAGVEHFAR